MPIPEQPPVETAHAADIRQVSTSIQGVLTGLSTALEQAQVALSETETAMDAAHDCAYFTDEALEELGEGMVGLENYVDAARVFLVRYGVGSGRAVA